MSQKDLEKIIGEITEEDIALSIKKRKRKNIIAKSLGLLTGLSFATFREMPIIRHAIQTNSAFFSEDLNPFHYKIALCSAALAFATHLIYTNYSSRLTSRKGLRNISRGTDLSLKSLVRNVAETDREEEIKYYTEALKFKDNPLEKLRLSAHIDFFRGFGERAFRKYARLLGAYEEHKVRPNISEIVMSFFAEFILKYTPFRRVMNPKTKIEAAFMHMHWGMPNKANQYLKSASSTKDLLQIQTNCLYGYFLDLRRKQGKPIEKARKQWHKTLELILSDPGLEFTTIGESRNEVLEVSGPGLIKDTFVFKRGQDKKHLEREFKLSRFLYEVFNGGDEVADPLDFLTFQNNPYLILRRMAGKPISEQGDQETLKQAIEFIHEFHSRTNSNLDLLSQNNITVLPIHYGRFLRNKFIRRLTNDPSKQEEFERATQFITDFLKKQKRWLIHGDLNPKNILRREKGFTAIDYEDMALAITNLDFARFLESHYLNLDEEATTSILRGSLVYNGKSFENFMLDQSYSSVFENLRVLVALQKSNYGMSPIQLNEVRKWYQQKASTSLQRITIIDPTKKDKTTHLEELLAA